MPRTELMHFDFHQDVRSRTATPWLLAPHHRAADLHGGKSGIQAKMAHVRINSTHRMAGTRPLD